MSCCSTRRRRKNRGGNWLARTKLEIVEGGKRKAVLFVEVDESV